MKTTILALLLSSFAFLSVVIQERTIEGLESRLHQQVLISDKTVERLAKQQQIIEELASTSVSQVLERDRDIFSQDRRIRDLSAALEALKSKTSPAPIGITPGQGTVRPPTKEN